MDIGQFLLANSNGILMTVLGWFYVKYPPKKINLFYGYRTRRSMANQQIWDRANCLCSKMILYLGLCLLVVGVLLYFFYPVNWIILITVFLMLIGLAIGMYWCETQLNLDFDKNGKPKSQI